MTKRAAMPRSEAQRVATQADVYKLALAVDEALTTQNERMLALEARQRMVETALEKAAQEVNERCNNMTLHTNRHDTRIVELEERADIAVRGATNINELATARDERDQLRFAVIDTHLGALSKWVSLPWYRRLFSPRPRLWIEPPL